MTTSIKISDLAAIGAAGITGTAILPIVSANLVTEKAAFTDIANVLLANATGAVYNRAASANTALTVINGAQANITSVGTLTSLAVTGTTTSGNFVGIFANTTSNISIPVAGGNILMTAGGTANVIVVAATGAYLSSANITGTGNIVGNANVGNLGTPGLIIATGNVSGANVIGTGFVKSQSTTVSSLAAAATAGAGARSFVTDGNLVASGTNFGAIIGGSQSNAVPVYSDGTNWRIG
jgi:hypothetical protein